MTRSRLWWIILPFLALVLHPVPSGSLHVETPPEASLAHGDASTPPRLQDYFSIEEMDQWRNYHLSRLRASLITVGSVLLFYVVLLVFGLSRRLRRLAEEATRRCYASPRLASLGARWPILAKTVRIPERLFGGREWLVVLIYCLLFFLVFEVCFFPSGFYRGYWYEVHHGLSNYTLGLWLVDWLKGFLLTSVLDACMVFGIYGLLARVGRRWWLLVWAGVSVAILGWVVIVPYQSRIYNRFHPLEAGQLRTRLEALARDQGLHLEQILVVDASRRTKKVNAYVQGTGPTRRLVLYDNVLQEFTPREIVMIFAHEMVHWKNPPGNWQYVVFSFTAFVVLFAVHRVLQAGSRIPWLHYSGPKDVASLPLLFLSFFLIFTLIRPVNLYWRRSHELETDRKALEMVCDPEAYVQMQAKLARLNRDWVDAPPLVVSLFHSHPSFLERTQAALTSPCGDLSLPSSAGPDVGNP